MGYTLPELDWRDLQYHTRGSVSHHIAFRYLDIWCISWPSVATQFPTDIDSLPIFAYSFSTVFIMNKPTLNGIKLLCVTYNPDYSPLPIGTWRIQVSSMKKSRWGTNYIVTALQTWWKGRLQLLQPRESGYRKQGARESDCTHLQIPHPQRMSFFPFLIMTAKDWWLKWCHLANPETKAVVYPQSVSA